MSLERSTIERALKESDDNIGTAARTLGASRRTLQNRMREYGMPRGRAGRRKRRLPYGGGRVSQGLGAAALAATLLGVGYLVTRKSA